MASNIANTINSRLRLSGMSSGLDTETMIKQLMKAESAKLDKAKQNKQVLEWKRDNYRDMTNLLRSFKDDYFDVLKPTSNMRSQNNYKIFSVSSSNTAITASANATAVVGAHTINVTDLASTAYKSSTTETNVPVQSIGDITNFNLAGRDFNVTMNGVTRNVKVTDISSDINTLKDAVQSAINKAFGENNITVSTNGNKLAFSSTSNKITFTSGTTDGLAQLMITSGTSNRLDMTKNLKDLGLSTPLTGTISFKINNVDFSFDASTRSMSDVMSEINSSNANVTMSYSEATGKFTLASKTTGAGNTVNIEDSSGKFFGLASATKIGFDIDGVFNKNGSDAKFKLDNVEMQRNTNSFTVDGVTYNLTDKVNATVTLTQDVNAVFDKIKAFVDKYNDVVSKISTELTEKHNRDYLPLTDDQKSNMKDEDIKKWEDKAKAGLLRSDGILQNTVNAMRRAISDAVSGVSGTLNSIGISTGSYQDNGKLTIDEGKLKDAIKNSPDKVMNLLSKESSVAYSADMSPANKAKRYNENGFINRLNDIIQDNIRTIRDSKGNKGILLEKAGITGDISEFSNLISKELDSQQKNIDNLIEKLNDKEEYYYKKFTAMESALSKMNSQSSWLTQQFGGSSS